MMQEMCPNAKQVLQKHKFDEQFGPGPEYANGDENDQKKREEEDEAVLFANRNAHDLKHVLSGNNDDKFRIGMSVSRRALKLFTPFYQSDILICSPLGLRLIIGDEQNQNREFDFLSSLECVVLDRVDVMKFQNLEHVMDCLKVCNVTPEASSSYNNKKPAKKSVAQTCDITRLRSCFALGESRLLRQTIITSNGLSPELDTMLVSSSSAGASGSDEDKQPMEENETTTTQQEQQVTTLETNFRGAVKLCGEYSAEAVQRARMELGIDRQMFLVAREKQRKLVSALTDEESSSALLRAFQKQFWQCSGAEMEYLTIVVSGSGYRYADYFTIQKFFKEEGVDFLAFDEYSEWLTVKEARLNFNKGNVRVLLLTERFLFYHPEFDIKSCQNLCFYGVPEKCYMQGLRWLSPFKDLLAPGSGSSTNKSKKSGTTPTRPEVPPACITLVDGDADSNALERILGTEFVKKKLRKAQNNKLFTFS
ncbi:unnamed protein product [Amoebophrya sp. A25]|nr:unnamed protein product [Amoebophrya sp. A25]|eukprot:GSA25T00000329001.1